MSLHKHRSSTPDDFFKKVSGTLPFNHIEDDNEFDNAIHSPVKSCKLFDADPLGNRSEDLVSSTGSCEYYDIDSYNSLPYNNRFSILHINCRSLYRNFDDI